jgi:hypothetical protein
MSAINEREQNGYYKITLKTLRNWIEQAEQLEKDGDVWQGCDQVQITRQTKEEEKQS